MNSSAPIEKKALVWRYLNSRPSWFGWRDGPQNLYPSVHLVMAGKPPTNVLGGNFVRYRSFHSGRVMYSPYEDSQHEYGRASREDGGMARNN